MRQEIVVNGIYHDIFQGTRGKVVVAHLPKDREPAAADSPEVAQRVCQEAGIPLNQCIYIERKDGQPFWTMFHLNADTFSEPYTSKTREGVVDLLIYH